mmetsp:Transcript_98946/g.277138  ORF Transcript_98946/g.277138 Transcript_98946/m.277138 type:complete len:226 (+) Transcript_98946:1685-2362(+)
MTSPFASASSPTSSSSLSKAAVCECSKRTTLELSSSPSIFCAVSSINIHSKSCSARVHKQSKYSLVDFALELCPELNRIDFLFSLKALMERRPMARESWGTRSWGTSSTTSQPWPWSLLTVSIVEAPLTLSKLSSVSLPRLLMDFVNCLVFGEAPAPEGGRGCSGGRGGSEGDGGLGAICSASRGWSWPPDEGSRGRSRSNGGNARRFAGTTSVAMPSSGAPSKM